MTAKIKGDIKVNAYAVLRRAIEEGVASGWRHAHKHTDNPDSEHIKTRIADDIMNEICEYFKFED